MAVFITTSEIRTLLRKCSSNYWLLNWFDYGIIWHLIRLIWSRALPSKKLVATELIRTVDDTKPLESVECQCWATPGRIIIQDGVNPVKKQWINAIHSFVMSFIDYWCWNEDGRRHGHLNLMGRNCMASWWWPERKVDRKNPTTTWRHTETHTHRHSNEKKTY